MQRGQPLANCQVIDLLNRRFVSFACLRICSCQKVVELFQVAGVVAQRVLADVTLITQMFEELMKKLVDHLDLAPTFCDSILGV